MQTFLPYPNLLHSIWCLDWKRLGKQRVEAKQILISLETRNRWYSHPAVQMWKEFESGLQQYHDLAIAVWIIRGFKNSMPYLNPKSVELPPWFGGEIHATHRSNLLRKDPQFYSQYNWSESPDIPYFWPTKKEEFK
jgi:hypothetical protein